MLPCINRAPLRSSATHVTGWERGRAKQINLLRTDSKDHGEESKYRVLVCMRKLDLLAGAARPYKRRIQVVDVVRRHHEIELEYK